ncbi:aminotransferase class V-fold PLP-dependent enzyme [Clostridium sp. CM028]|uniref:aminotransferase class V-fold PLP-dependent enzyme n=1 Tax=Clostridium sp. CM028 TaxID=2851575 RepID=UPI001C6EA960|nr:aminotransferase class V-fold PLP-dependent enzyme [Clostridium sp. CM028]MBW9150282.1 aminotransferase class V-fold PLP-dependent enzyme [Clostridium sp. CM028]WLC62842.1 aminotransferase class V-fold PLP-dependent enzyme [Clostridium sp. CM028]
MEKTIYLDNAATTFPKPNKVYEYMDMYYRGFGVNAGRSSYKLAREASNLIIETRNKLASLVNYDRVEKVIFTPSATIALNQIISGLEWNESKTVYVTPFEHNAVMRPLEYIKEKFNIKIEIMPFDSVTFEVDIVELNLMFSRNFPDFIFMSHISNVTGFILPVQEIIEASEKYDSIIILDCSQSMGLIPIDVKKIKADYFVFAGHKTLYGPFGIGGFIDNSRVELSEVIIGGTGSDSLNLKMPDVYPGKYEAASPNILSIAGLHSALEWINHIGIDNIREKEDKLTKALIEGLKGIDEVKMYLPGNLNNHVGIVSFTIENYKPDELGQIFDQDFNIAVRTGYHCAPIIHNFIETENIGGTVRISLGYFNTEAEIDCLIKALNEI